MESAECVVVGAGVIGLAVARRLALAGREVLLLEAAESIGTETSSRNSEVIHAGIYYRPGSLMARLCTAGKTALYSYCREHDVSVAKCGKLIVATLEEEKNRLAEISAHAAANGVALQSLSAQEATALEPALSCTGALLSSSTGIVDSHAFMISLLGQAQAAGALLALLSPVLGGRVDEHGFILDVGGADPMRLRCSVLVNCAGLHAPDLARNLRGMPAKDVPTAYFAKGSYFTLSGPSPFSRLIYPVPVPGGLGTHLTMDLAGRTRFGPDVEWVSVIDYKVDPARGELFYAAIRRYWPDLRDGQLQPGYAGIRPKIVPPSRAVQDFLIQSSRTHGVSGLINLFGIESPGLTASLAIADYVLALTEH